MHFSTSFLFTCLHLIESFRPYRHANLKRLELFEKLFEIEKRDNRKDTHIHSFFVATIIFYGSAAPKTMTHQFDEFAFHPTSGWIVYRGNAAAKRMRHKGSFLFDRNPDFNGSVGIKDCVITASRPIFVNSIITEYLIRVNAFPLPPRHIPAPHGEGLPPPAPHGPTALSRTAHPSGCGS